VGSQPHSQAAAAPGSSGSVQLPRSDALEAPFEKQANLPPPVASNGGLLVGSTSPNSYHNTPANFDNPNLKAKLSSTGSKVEIKCSSPNGEKRSGADPRPRSGAAEDALQAMLREDDASLWAPSKLLLLLPGDDAGFALCEDSLRWLQAHPSLAHALTRLLAQHASRVRAGQTWLASQPLRVAQIEVWLANNAERLEAWMQCLGAGGAAERSSRLRSALRVASDPANWWILAGLMLACVGAAVVARALLQGVGHAIGYI
jgi:hypothetical protein